MKKFIHISTLTILSLISFALYAQQQPAKPQSQQQSQEEDILSSVPLELFDADEDQVREALKLRDPFKRPAIARSGRKTTLADGPKTNFTQNVPSIEGVPLRAIRIVGILLGEERRAIAKIVEGVTDDASMMDMENAKLGEDSYLLREGMKIGENNAEIKAILPGGIVLVEKIRNVYDQDEYLETIIPITYQ